MPFPRKRRPVQFSEEEMLKLEAIRKTAKVLHPYRLQASNYGTNPGAPHHPQPCTLTYPFVLGNSTF